MQITAESVNEETAVANTCLPIMEAPLHLHSLRSLIGYTSLCPIKQRNELQHELGFMQL